MKRVNTAIVVLPSYGVEGAMELVVRDLAVAAYALSSRGIDMDVLVYDGGDDGAAVAELTAAQLGLKLTTVPGPPSPGEAYLDGFRRVVGEGRADFVITLDANGRHDGAQIPHLIDRLLTRDLDVVIGSRWARGSGTPGLTPVRWVLGRLANLAFRVLTGTRGIKDATTSFRVARAHVVRDIDFTGIPIDSQSVQTTFAAMAVAAGRRVGEAPIIYREAVAGGGGLHLRDVVGFVRHLKALRQRVDRTRQRRLTHEGRRFVDGHFGAAEDLERLGTSKYFFDWVIDEFEPYLTGRVLEVGAGIGTITRKLVERYPEMSVVALEPADNMYPDLDAYAALSDRVVARQETLVEYRVDEHDRFDAVLYVNVLEHISGDREELQRAAEVLRPGGALLVFGPALEWLYSELDYHAGHYRRYSTKQLRHLVEDAGLKVLSIRYFDVLGVLPYYVVYKLLRHASITGSTIWGYDRMIVPLSRLIQRMVRKPPLGKNVILVAVKP